MKLCAPAGARENGVGGFLPFGGVAKDLHISGNSIAPAGADFSSANQPGMSTGDVIPG
jgi:hypothetical protein